MEQRRLRLGDILDDYCPRERRVTNHAIVAMIEDDIKQTRCTTCDAEHAYKGAKAPRRRKNDAPALVPPTAETPASIDATGEEPVEERIQAEHASEPIEPDEPLESEPAAAAAETDADAEEQPLAALEDGPVHRPLIRATLPRPEGQKTERPLPDFTMRHANGRGDHAFRGNGRPKMRTHGGGSGGSGGGNGNRPHGGRFSGPRQGPGRGGPHAAGFRSGPPRHGGKKRSR